MVTLKADEKGASTILVISLILLTVFFLGATGFAFWAYSGKQDYKNNVDAKVQVAVDKAVKAEDAKKDAQFAEDSKKPLKPYNGPSAFGSIKLYYPKTWSAYIIENSNEAAAIDGYLYPDFVPSTMNINNLYALRLQVVSQSYSAVVHQYDPQVKSGKVTATPYSLSSLKTVIGVKIDGAITPTKSGSMVILPLRDKTLKVWTEGSQFTGDFNNNILPNLTFSP